MTRSARRVFRLVKEECDDDERRCTHTSAADRGQTLSLQNARRDCFAPARYRYVVVVVVVEVEVVVVACPRSDGDGGCDYDGYVVWGG